MGLLKKAKKIVKKIAKPVAVAAATYYGGPQAGAAVAGGLSASAQAKAVNKQTEAVSAVYTAAANAATPSMGLEANTSATQTAALMQAADTLNSVAALERNAAPPSSSWTPIIVMLVGILLTIFLLKRK